jgi:hypothetical protein
VGLVDGYIAQREKTVAKSTVNSYKQTRKSLGDYFGDDKPLADITVADANASRRWMLTTKLDAKRGCSAAKGLADNTARRRCGFARQFFNEAIDARLITENPFHKMKGIGVRANRSRDYFLSREDAEKVVKACPDNEWKLLFALSRFGGLRCPSEHLAHNLRATRQTELAKLHPAHVVCAWIGNSQTVAQKHYLQVTDDDFRDAQKTAPNPARASH